MTDVDRHVEAAPAIPGASGAPDPATLGARVHGERARYPVHTGLGLALIGVCWPLYWTTVTVWSHALFFGLWLGYILTVDGLVYRRTGGSLLTSGARPFVLLFVFSVPFWWMYEWCNWALRSWTYAFPAPMDRFTTVLMSSLTFATVLPALFETAQLLGSAPIFRRPWRGPRVPLNGPLAWAVSALGVAALVLVPLFPGPAFFLAWLFPLLILDPINSRTGHGGIWAQLAAGRWRLPFVLAAAGLVCGFFWEFWNYWSVGLRWTYHLPAFVSHPHVFQMPLAGYLGYLPFAGSAYACYQSVRTLIAPRSRHPVELV